VVAEVPNRALTDEAPVYRRPMKAPAPAAADVRVDEAARSRLPRPSDALMTLLASPTIASKRWVYRQYDHMVRTNTIVLTGLSAGVVRVKGTSRALAMSVDGNGRFCALDPRQGARLAVAEAARNVACVGAVPIGATNCLNFGNPERPEIMWQFAEAVAGIGDACRALGIPITGGNVSLYNETDGRAILPTPVLGVVGLIENVDPARIPTRIFPAAGLSIVALGTNRGELGGSEYAHTMLGSLLTTPPSIDLASEKALQAWLADAIARGHLQSAHDCAEGGFAVTLAESCFESGGIGATVAIATAPGNDAVDPLAATLFGESASRVIVSVRREHLEEVLQSARVAGVPATEIGTTGESSVRVSVDGVVAIDVPVLEAEARWSASLANWMDGRAA
jgi:phosphoribosylformylglycinamidine synthase